MTEKAAAVEGFAELTARVEAWADAAWAPARAAVAAWAARSAALQARMPTLPVYDVRLFQTAQPRPIVGGAEPVDELAARRSRHRR